MVAGIQGQEGFIVRKIAIGALVLASALFATSASARDSGFRGGPRKDAKSAAAPQVEQSAAAAKVSKEVPAAKAKSPAAKTPAAAATKAKAAQ